MEKIQHKNVNANGISIHVAELGQGPLVLFLHGFPELWYSWRHQIRFLADSGYRAVAPDLRGYGDTTGAPIDDPSKFTVVQLVGDVVALLGEIAPDEDKVFVVGHDWGAFIAWHLALFRPDKVKAMVILSVPFMPRNPSTPLTQGLRAFYGDDHYIWRFQEHGYIESVIAEVGVRAAMKKFLTFRGPAPFYFPKDKGFSGFPDTSAESSSWLSEEDLDYFASKFEKTGFTGGVNYYRAVDTTWELTAPWTGVQVKVPSKFVVGELDVTYHMPGAKQYIHDGEFQRDVPFLQEVVVLDGAAHYINQERPNEIANHIYEFISKF